MRYMTSGDSRKFRGFFRENLRNRSNKRLLQSRKTRFIIDESANKNEGDWESRQPKDLLFQAYSEQIAFYAPIWLALHQKEDEFKQRNFQFLRSSTIGLNKNRGCQAKHTGVESIWTCKVEKAQKEEAEGQTLRQCDGESLQKAYFSLDRK